MFTQQVVRFDIAGRYPKGGRINFSSLGLVESLAEPSPAILKKLTLKDEKVEWFFSLRPTPSPQNVLLNYQ